SLVGQTLTPALAAGLRWQTRRIPTCCRKRLRVPLTPKARPTLSLRHLSVQCQRVAIRRTANAEVGGDAAVGVEAVGTAAVTAVTAGRTAGRNEPQIGPPIGFQIAVLNRASRVLSRHPPAHSIPAETSPVDRHPGINQSCCRGSPFQNTSVRRSHRPR